MWGSDGDDRDRVHRRISILISINDIIVIKINVVIIAKHIIIIVGIIIVAALCIGSARCRATPVASGASAAH